MPNSDSLKSKIEALRCRGSVSVQGGAKAETSVSPAPTSAPASAQAQRPTSPHGGLDKSRLEALRGRVNPVQTPAVSKDKTQQGFATQKELEEGLATPVLDAFLEEILVKIQSGN